MSHRLRQQQLVFCLTRHAQVVHGVVLGGDGAIVFHRLLWRSARHAFVRGVAEGIKPFRGVAQREEVNPRANVVQQLAVAQAHRITGIVPIVRQLAAGVGQVDGVGAKAAEVLPKPEGQAVIAIGKLRPAVKRQAVSPAVEQFTLRERGRILIARRTVFPGAEGIFHLSVTHQVRHAGKGERVLRFAAVVLLNGDRQIASRGGRVEIFQHKRPRRDGGLIDDVAVLANRDRGVAARDAANFRCIAAEAGGQHVVIGFQGDTAQAHGVEHLRRGVRFPGIHLRAQGVNIALQPGLHVGELIAVFGPRGEITQPPRAQVDAAVEARKQLLLPRARLAAILIVRAIDHVIQPRGRNARLPAFRADVPARQIAHRTLRYGEAQGERLLVQIKLRIRKRLR